MNGSGSTTVKSELLRQVADQMEAQAKKYQTLADNLFNIGTQLDQMWDGDANESFNALLKNDQPKFKGMFDGIMVYVKFLRDTADEYENAENKANNIVISNTIRG